MNENIEVNKQSTCGLAMADWIGTEMERERIGEYL
jgi:hypothetical protein